MGVYNSYINVRNTDMTQNDILNGEHFIGKQPYGDYNALGQLQGYFWYYGDTINLSIDLFGNAEVEKNSIIFYAHGEAPNAETIADINQRAYNIADSKAWQCVATGEWEEIPYNAETVGPTTSMYITAQEYLKGKKAIVRILNFRHEEVFCKEMDASNRISINLDKETSEKFTRGTYYLTLQLSTDYAVIYAPILKYGECRITVL